MAKLNPWDDTPTTFTEFGPLSSEVKPAGSFFSRWLRRGKGEEAEHSGSSSRTGSTPSSREGSVERRQLSAQSYTAIERLAWAGSAERLLSRRMDVGTGGAGGSGGGGSGDGDGDESAVEERVSDQAKVEEEETSSVGGDNSSPSGESSDGRLGQMADRMAPRNLSSVLSRLSNILDRRSTTPQTYKDSDFKQYWMPDSSCKECYDCGDRFTTFRRRHHCRICGQIFCSKCCNQELPGKIIGYKGGIRVCDYCCKVVQRYTHQSVSTGEVKVLRDEIRNMSSGQLDMESGSFEYGMWSPVTKRRPLAKEDLTLPQQRSSTSPEMTSSGTEKSAPFDLTPQSEFSSQESLLMETRLLTQDSLQLRALWRQVLEADTGLEMQTHRVRLRTHQNCIVGRELVDWLIRNDKAVKREQAVAIGQALMFGGYIETIGNQLPVFKDDFSLYKPGESVMESQTELQVLPSVPEERESSEPLWFREIESNEDTDDGTMSMGDEQRSTAAESDGPKSLSSESEARTSTLSASSKSDTGSVLEYPKLSFMSRDMAEEPLPRQDSSATGLSDDFLKGTLFLSRAPVPSSDIVTCPQGWRTVDELREENGEKLAYERLKQAHTEHLQTMTRQLLSQQGLSASWEPVVLSCVRQVTHFVRPDVRGEGDDLDVRKYIHIKKIPVGQKQDSSLIHGLVFTKNIAHKKMRQQIANPHILLLRGAIEYQRVENKFSSLEPQILQEREFLKNSVAKIAAFHPNIVVVEKSVSRLAQEYLLEAGITLVFNVKQSVMERLARFTQADIVPSIDGLVSKPNLGFCHDFHCQSHSLPNRERKTVVVFAGCATHLGCTISLVGASLTELKRVKLILKFMSYVAYNSLLELCFAMDEFAMPPPGSEELAENMEGFDSSTDINSTEISHDEPTDITEFTDNQGHTTSVAKDTSSAGKEKTLEKGKEAAVSKPDDIATLEKEKETAVSKADDNTMSEKEKGRVVSKADDITTHYMSLTEAMDEEEVGKENVAPPPGHSESHTHSGGLEAPAMKRQLSAVTELTDCSDPLLSYQKSQDESIFRRSHSIQFREQKQTMWHQFRLSLHGTLLSASPYIKFSIPFLESEAGAKCFARAYLPPDIYWSALFTGERTHKDQRLSKGKYGDGEYGGRYQARSYITITEAHPFVLSDLIAPANDNAVLTLLADFRARGGRIYVSEEARRNGFQRDCSPKARKDGCEETLTADNARSGVCWEKKTDCLDVWNHQRLSVLFSSYSYRSPNHPNPCVYPWVVTMAYYGRNDITLGGFLERFCFRESYTCPSPTCEVPMVDHIRRFVHGQGCLNVLLKKLDNPVPGAQDNILLWSWCRRCKQVTPVVPISADTWNMSFAKYLDLRFHCSSFRRRGCAEPCTHSLHTDHYQYFGHRDIVASFKYASVTLRELALPGLVVELPPTALDVGEALRCVKAITNKGMDRFCTILEITMKLKAEMTGDSAARNISDFLTEQQEEKNQFRDAATKIHHQLTEMRDQGDTGEVGPAFDIQDSIVLLKRRISESVQRWNNRIQDLMSSQQKKSRTSKKEKELASSCDEVERLLPRTTTTEERSLSISVIPVDMPPTSSPDLRAMEDPRTGTSVQGNTGSILLTSIVEPPRDSPNNGKGEGEDSVDGWFSDLRGSARRWLSNTVFTPLALPFDPSEHHLLQPCERVPVVVYDQEPSSIIAYALSSADYQMKLREVQAFLWGTPKDTSSSSGLSSRGSKANDLGSITVESVLETDDPEGLSMLTGSAVVPDTSDKNKVGKQPTSVHIELQFSDPSAKFYCRVYFAEQFRKLRKHIFPDGEEMFIRSLSRCKPWEARGGKSGSAFCKTDDDRFIMKQMSSMEADSFEKFGPHYFHYITKACTDKSPTALAKILGVYRIGFRNTQTNATLKQDLLVMENLFYNRKISQKFDLKGSMRNRLVNTAGKQAEEELVLLDENLLKSSVDSPLYLRSHSKSVLKAAITSDSTFLSSNFVMDYSLLVGLDDVTKEMVVGIIDYIRTFTWDKKLEMVIKTPWGGQGKMPTVVSPQLYRGRFLEAMDRYFLHVPDQWSGLGRDFPSTKEQQKDDADVESSQTSSRR
ncbi:1-phosphatidylinositol 3-phosphate 5-kinase-like isoform X2 [Babylonia areolata]|uniref:1-phosphatidylinositol 3-phosphate 5-kinase-like isoform X2 n=1 Tax=Babylonia areolata TaxID=304850 RepID=UPI003FD04FE8